MDITLDSTNSRYLIRAYEAGRFHINDEIISHSVIVTPEQLIHPWKPQNFNALKAQNLTELMISSPEIILIGTGERWQMIPPEWLMLFYELQIGVEVMSTHSACTTFNVLASEGRKVVAGLLIA